MSIPEIDECKSSQPRCSDKNMVCVDKINSYTCVCKSGFVDNGNNTCRGKCVAIVSASICEHFPHYYVFALV